MIDWKYIRVSACFKLLKRGSISSQRAIELMKAKGVKNAAQTVSLWMRSKHMRECINEQCNWHGPENETVHPKHVEDARLCPECHDVTESA